VNGETLTFISMKLTKRFCVTLLVIVYSLFHRSQSGGDNIAVTRTIKRPANSARRIETTDDIRFYLSELNRWVDANGELYLHFDSCYSIAAPFLLYLLKKRGFSNGRAISSANGLQICARR
jgi:hypothetical protein